MNTVAPQIITLIAEKKIDIKSAVDIVKVTMQEVEKMKSLSGLAKQKIVLEVIKDIAKGPDGISGTSDDLIPEHIMAGVHTLIEHELLPAIINVIIDASNGKLDVNKVSGCFHNLLQSIATCSKGTQ